MFAFFFLIWVVFNGAFTLEIALFGLAISALVYWFTRKHLDVEQKSAGIKIKVWGLAIKYIFVLIWEIIKANVAVIGMIGSSKYDIQPAVVKFTSDIKSERLRVILANSITLTPGTITASLDGNEFIVHCLDKSLADQIDKSVFVKQLELIESVKEGKGC